MASPVHRHDRLARPRPAGDPGGSVEGLGDESLLAGVQEDPPLLQRGIEDRVEFLVGVDGHEPATGIGMLEGRRQVRRIHLLTDSTADPLLDEVAAGRELELCPRGRPGGDSRPPGPTIEPKYSRTTSGEPSPSASQMRALAASEGKCWPGASNSSGRPNRPDGREQDRGDAERQEVVVLDRLHQPGGFAPFAAVGMPGFHLFDVEDLQRSGTGVDLEGSVRAAQAIASSWLSTQSRTYTSPCSG